LSVKLAQQAPYQIIDALFGAAMVTLLVAVP
jgi:hypothetical protein